MHFVMKDDWKAEWRKHVIQVHHGSCHWGDNAFTEEEMRRYWPEDFENKTVEDMSEKQAAEKAEKERLEKEAAEKAAREQAEREAAEKAAKEQAELEAAEQAAKEQAELEAAEKAAKEQAEREAAEQKTKQCHKCGTEYEADAEHGCMCVYHEYIYDAESGTYYTKSTRIW